jgi:hypothetical protein
MSVVRGGPRTTGHRYKFSLVACARWEEYDIVEWVEYHRSLGFDHIYIYSNDDDPMVLQKVLLPYLTGNNPYITYRYWPVVGQQPEIYFHFMKNFKNETEWFSFLDIDEFFVFKDAANVGAFMARFEGRCDALYFNWLIFGNNGFVRRERDSVLLAYTLRSAQIDLHTKVITRSACVDAEEVLAAFRRGTIGFWHFWGSYYPDTMRHLNVIGDDMRRYSDPWPSTALDYIQREGVSAAVVETAFVAHFQFQSEEDFARRIKRGGFDNGPHWARMVAEGRHKQLLEGLNRVEDTYLARYWLATAGSAYAFKAMQSVATPLLPNIALRKPASQSSIYDGPVSTPMGAHVRGHANNGVHTGSFGFHTQREERPWWRVDLLDQYVVHEVHIYNREDDPDCTDRAQNLAVEISSSGEDWVEIFSLDGRATFGGAKSGPLVIHLPTPLTARYMRVLSKLPTFLHLDEIEVYGEPLRPAV